MSGWTPKKIIRLRELAATGMIAIDIAEALGRTELGIITFCARNNIDVVRYSPEQQAIYDRRAVEREEKRQERKRAVNHERKVAERAAAIARGAAAMVRSDYSPVAVKAAFSKTAPAYRNQLGAMPEMSKTALREMLAEVARNTAALPIPAEASI